MVDIELLRSQPEIFRASQEKRFGDLSLIDEVVECDKQWRQAVTTADQLRSTRNELSKTKESAQKNATALKELKKKLEGAEEKEQKLREQRRTLLLRVPNILAADVPVGKSESANMVIETIGKITQSTGRPHEELMQQHDWLDLDTAAQASGARFRYLKKEAALAEMSLMQLAMRFAASKGFIPLITPAIARESTLEMGGFFPGGKEETFQVNEQQYLTGTSEPMLVAQAMAKTYQESELPLRFVGFSTCFRQEAGSYGKDVKGMFRQHQFDKVEMVSITTGEQSEAEHEFLLSMEKEFINQFNLPYQVVLIGSGDVETKSVKRFDIETWFPGQQRYRETHSVSNVTDYQARRFDIKVRRNDGRIELGHTLNGTLATERLLLAIIENNQDGNGHVSLPPQLKAQLGQ